MERVKVFVRSRPMNDSEIKKGTVNCVTFSSTAAISVSNPDKKDDTKQFTYDGVFDPSSTQVC